MYLEVAVNILKGRKSEGEKQNLYFECCSFDKGYRPERRIYLGAGISPLFA